MAGLVAANTVVCQACPVHSRRGGRGRSSVLHRAVAITDTSPAAQTLQLQIQRAMTGEQRMTVTHEMSMFARELTRQVP